VTLSLGVLSCRGAKDEALTVPPGTPIVLISIDTLRSDRLPAYGYDRVATPAIDSLRADSILFERAYTHAPLTLPAHASLFTGLYPAEHGVRDNAGYRLASQDLPYLPRILGGLGYKTGAAVSAFVLRGTAGLDSGFDLYDDRIPFSPKALLSSIERDGPDTLSVAREWLESVAAEPFFLFFHIYEPHAPHQPPEPYASRYDSPYDGEVAAADAVVGELLRQLRAAELYDRSLILLLSDHGEGLYDHGDYEHGLLLYREALQIPLLLKLPSSERGGSTVERPVGLIDVLPTLLELLDVEVPAELPGRSLLSAAKENDKRVIYAETFFPRLHFSWSELFSVIDYPYLYIEGPDPELYDLEQDPAQRQNLLRQERRVLGVMRQQLDEYDQSFAGPAAEDPETRERLAALGYLGSVSSNTTGPLPDPKSQLHALEDLKAAFEHYAQHRYAEAVEGFRGVLAEQPQLIDAWEQLGHSLVALGRVEEGLAAFEKAMELSAGAPQVAGVMATTLFRLGRLEEAREYAELAVDGHEQSRDVLAQITVRQGDLETAEAVVNRAVNGRGTRIGPLITKAELRFMQKRFEETLRLTSQAAEEHGDRPDKGPLKGLYYLRGSAFAQMGQLDRATDAYRREIELFPTEVTAYGSLAIIQALQRRLPESRRTLERMLEVNPTPEASAEAVRTLRILGDEAGAARLLAEALQRWPEDPGLRGLG
jgi:arylsulfatase A-like enzyme/Flp pilus assembly protein TadD